MRFAVDFHGPFRVATGHAARGADASVDVASPLPAASLKGVMRASAELLLPRRHDLVELVFGSPRSPSPWSWSSASVPDASVRKRARVAIDPDRHAALPGALLFAEEVWARTASFTVQPLARVADRRTHELVLLASAHGVHALGGDRRRGLGWVTVRGTDPILDGDALDAFAALGGVRA